MFNRILIINVLKSGCMKCRRICLSTELRWTFKSKGAEIMKNKKAVILLTALLAVGTISPMAAYGAAAVEESAAATSCRNPEDCQECMTGECPVCTSAECGVCGGNTEDGVCVDCGETMCHTCRKTECAEAGGCSRHTSGGNGHGGHHSEKRASGNHHSGTRHSNRHNFGGHSSGVSGTGKGAHHGYGC